MKLLLILGVLIWGAGCQVKPAPGGDAADVQPIVGSTTEGEMAAETVLAQKLEIPWETVTLTDGTRLVTQRSGQLVRLYPDTKTTTEIAGVVHRGEGGLMGMALHPQYEANHWLYLMMTTQTEQALVNRVVRYTLNEAGNRVDEERIILDGIPGAANHDGGRLKFGPDGKLYVTTGDAQQENLAQETNSLAGKVLRINDDGTIPADNPFGNAVWSRGHRNVQGIAWDEQGRLWATEHGPSGLQSGCDEINLIVKGGNYGWPKVRCEQAGEGLISPVRQSGRTETWAPGGAAVINGWLVWTGLKGESVYRSRIQDDKLLGVERLMAGKYGRIRTINAETGGRAATILTSNRDGRGRAEEEDDRLIRLRTDLLLE